MVKGRRWRHRTSPTAGTQHISVVLAALPQKHLSYSSGTTGIEKPDILSLLHLVSWVSHAAFPLKVLSGFTASGTGQTTQLWLYCWGAFLFLFSFFSSPFLFFCRNLVSVTHYFLVQRILRNGKVNMTWVGTNQPCCPGLETKVGLI